MVSTETKTKVIEKIKELEDENKRLKSELEHEIALGDFLKEQSTNAYKTATEQRLSYTFQKEINATVKKFLIAGSILFGVTFFSLGYLFGTKHEAKYQPVQQQINQPQFIEVKKEPEQKKYTSEMEEILDKAFEKYK